MENETGSTNSTGDIDWEGLARYTAGEADPAEAKRLEQWLAEHPEHEASLSVLFAAIGRLRVDGGVDLSEADSGVALRAVKSRAISNEPAIVAIESRLPAKRWSVGHLAIAAGLVIAMAGLGLRYIVNAPKSTVTQIPAIANNRTYTTQVGASDSVLLSDGSRIALAPGSSLVVAAGYGQTHRTVTLRGEAFFVAVHDTTHAFTVIVDGATVRDIGTSFSVRADRPKTVRVSVASGSVVLRAASDSGTGTALHASDVAVMENTVTGRVIVRRSSGPVPSGQVGQIVFDEATMGEVAEVLHRWFGIDMTVDSAVARRHVTASLTNLSATEAVNVITRAIGATADWQKTAVALHNTLPPNRPR